MDSLLLSESLKSRKVAARNRYYEAGPKRAERVHELFAAVAARYDLINDVQSFRLHRVWKGRLLKRAAPKRGELALDVCCGTGDVTLSLAGAGAHCFGLDFCLPMLEVALRRSSRAPSAKCAFVHGDAQSLPFPDESFDVITISYGLRNLPDWKAGLVEMWRVLRSGGRLLILDFSFPRNRVWRAVYQAYLRGALPCFGWLMVRDAQAYAYILESLRHYPDPGTLSNWLSELGGREVDMLPLLGGIMTIHEARRDG